MIRITRTIVMLFMLANLFACNDKAKDYKHELREGTWYVYDIVYDYKFYNKWATPELSRYINFLLDERNLLFLPGDEVSFSSKRIHVTCPDNNTYSHRYYFWGRYIRVNVDGIEYPINPEGNNDEMRLTFDKNALRQLLSELGEEGLLNDLESNLKKFYIDYILVRPLPQIVQDMAGTYKGELYDGTDQQLNKSSILHLFWENSKMELSLDDKIQLENGPNFFIEIPDLTISKGETNNTYIFSGIQYPAEDTKVTVSGHINASGILDMDATIIYKDIEYSLHYLDGIRQRTKSLNAPQPGEGIFLRSPEKTGQ